MPRAVKVAEVTSHERPWNSQIDPPTAFSSPGRRFAVASLEATGPKFVSRLGFRLDDRRHERACAPSHTRGLTVITALCTIVVTYNSEAVILSCLRSLQSSTVPSRVIVVDSGSSDRTVELVTRSFPEVRVLEECNRGFAAGCNRGVEMAGEGYEAYFFLNPDAEVTPSCLELLVGALDEDDEFAIVSPTVRHRDGALVQYAGALLDFESLKFDVFTSLDTFRDRGVRETGRPAGAAMLARATAVRAIGPMEESYFLYWEECEWAARVQAKGLKIGYVPSASVYHTLSHSTGGMGSGLYEYYYTRNFMRLVADVKMLPRLEAARRLVPVVMRRVWTTSSRHDLKRLIRLLWFDALGVWDFLSGRTGHRCNLPPVAGTGTRCDD
jgi:GT2 family glycosyltransferase